MPASLSVFSQRAGRAGRSANIKAHAFLLAEKSMFKRKKKKKPGGKRVKKPDETSSESDGNSSGSGSEMGSDDGKEWGKKVDENLREYISTTGCRTIVNDKYFNNPPRPSPEFLRPGKSYLVTSVSAQLICKTEGAHCDVCDNCLNIMADLNSRPATPESNLNSSPSSSVHSSPSKTTNSNGKRSMGKSAGCTTRRGEHLKAVRTELANQNIQYLLFSESLHICSHPP